MRGTGGVAARLWDRQGHGAEVRQPVPDLDPPGRPWLARREMGGRAAGWSTAATLVQADSEWTGKGQDSSGGNVRHCSRAQRRGPCVWTPSGNPGGVVGGLTRALSALLRHSAWVLPAERRQWAQAAWADSAQVPAGRRRLEWLIGGCGWQQDRLA